jgi:hypothetical protein
VNRRLAIVLAALVIPGGFVALFGAAVVKAISRTETGRKAWDRMTTLWRRPPIPVQPLRQAA